MKPARLLARSFAALLLVAAAGCGPSDESHAVRGSGPSAGMDGELRLLPEFQASNARVKLELRSVPPPSRFHSSATVFVVWNRGAGVTNLGALSLDPAQHTARFEKVIPNGPFDLLITAESSADVRVPSSRTLLVQRMSGISH